MLFNSSIANIVHLLQKRNAPAPPSVSQSIYGTLPHAPRNSQNLDSADYRGVGGGGSGGGGNKNAPDMYSTLPHLRNTDSKGIGFHYDNKMYERFEPLMTATQQAKYDKHKLEQGSASDSPPPPTVMTTFGHKRSPSGESLTRNLHLAGAKLVLPSGEIPTLKPVDKNLLRPKLPPPGPPLTSNNGSGKWF